MTWFLEKLIWLLEKIHLVIQDPFLISVGCTLYIVFYYIVSALFLNAKQKDKTKSWLKKNGLLDKITSFFWLVMAFFLVSSLLDLCIRQQIPLEYLILYYFFFIFCFAFCYGLLEWHFPGILEEVNSSTWESEFQYIVISIQTQTTLGYTNAKPAKPITELIACLQALLGLFFCIIFIAKAVAFWK